VREAPHLPARFERPRHIGAGAFGVVYDVFDRVRAERVAVKTLPPLGDGDDAVQFRASFARLAALTHPRLVRLYELIEEAGCAWYAMRLVEGRDVLSYVRGAAVMDDTAARVVMGQTLRDASAYSSCTPEAVSRLRMVVAQIADGLAALHASGHVHGDLGPTNVLVDAKGDVYLADYGPQPPAPEGHVAGTAAYMAPEQGAPGGTSPASDWYALGVVLFEALTGALPFAGDAQEVLVRKSTVRAIPPGLLAAGVPADLEALCMALLERQPADRPTGDDIVKQAHAIARAGR
jgi:serine/threonine protein kinase